jgi:pimeloyl-[acyl-carrier protein] methyl ester esterase
MTQILAVHGWAGHAEQWTYWRRLMEQRQWPMQVMERGYGNNTPTRPSWTDKAGPRVVIAHSLGLHFLPAATPSRSNSLGVTGVLYGFRARRTQRSFNTSWPKGDAGSPWIRG